MSNFEVVRQTQRNQANQAQLRTQIEQLQTQNLELKTRLQCNEFNFQELLEATWLLAKLSEIDGVRYARAVELALSTQVDPDTQVQVRESTYLSVRQIRSVLKSMGAALRESV